MKLKLRKKWYAREAQKEEILEVSAGRTQMEAFLEEVRQQRSEEDSLREIEPSETAASSARK